MKLKLILLNFLYKLIFELVKLDEFSKIYKLICWSVYVDFEWMIFKFINVFVVFLS